MTTESVSFDWLVDKYIGSTGRWQVQQVILVLLCTFASSFPLYIHLFTAFVPKHRCLVPACDNNGTDYNEHFLEFAIPKAEVTDDFLGVSEAFSQCEMYIAQDSSCTNSSFTKETMSCNQGYMYSKDLFESTLATETNLVCDHESLEQLISSVIPFGIFIGSFIGGPIADRRGRRPPLIIGSVLTTIALAISGAFVDYYVFIVCRFLVAMAAGISWVANRPMELELFGVRHRSQAMFIDNGLYQLFAQLAAIMAYFISDWQQIHFLSAFLTAIPATMTILFLYESPRWLALNGDEKRFFNMLHNVVKINKGKLTNNDEVIIRDYLVKLRLNSISGPSESSFLALFKGQLMPRIALTTFMLIIGCVAQYSLTFGSVTSLSGNIFVNFCLTFMVSIPVYVFFFFFSPARKPALIAILATMGVSSCINAFLDKTSHVFVLIFVLITRLTANAVLNFGAVFTSELFPTVVRAQALGFTSAASKLVASASPFLENLGDFWQPTPLLMIGITSLLAGALLLLLPETKDKPLMDTLPTQKGTNEEKQKC